MGNHDTIVTHYAILIGINAYSDRPLTGCVQDVQEIKSYFKEVLNSVYITMFTAIGGTDLKSNNLAEGPVLWPTYDNVTSAFREVTSLAKAGDFVYIHYSGHGTRTESHSEFSNESTGDLAFVLFDKEKENGERYLRGLILAHLLKAMADKELVITLVLDCCFSATVYRDNDPTIRFLPFDAEIDSKYPLSLENHGDETDRPTNRDASMRPNWLINPDGYAILVACGPHEVAKGITSRPDGQNHGALSYFLLKTLKECGGLRKKHMIIYNHLCARFREFSSQQNPVLYGNKDQGFFGHISSGIDINPILIVEREENLQLQAGQAHGVCDDDQFTLYPLSSVEGNFILEEKPVIAKISRAGALTSYLNLLKTTSICPQTGWIAEPLTRAFYLEFPIRLASDLPYQDWQTALKKRSLNIHINTEQRSFSFHVLLNNDEYEIRDESDHKIINLPTMVQDQFDISSVCDILEHLVKYKLVGALVNKMPTETFLKSFKAQIISQSKEVFDPGCMMEVKQNEETFELQVENKGSKDLYVYVYDMGPCWQVQNIFHGSYEVIPPLNAATSFRGMFQKRLKTIIPSEMREKGHLQCQDIVKVLVTSKPTSFDVLELPKLGKSVKRKPSGRIPLIDNDISEEWAALNFAICTSLKQIPKANYLPNTHLFVTSSQHGDGQSSWTRGA